MTTIRTGVAAEDVLQSARHILFVEGSSQEGLDPTVLGELMAGIIRVEPLGPCLSIRSAAEALFPHHRTYYFLIDRDHHTDDEVETSWGRFPDPETYNLLIWRKKELENYFLEPEWVKRSCYFRSGRSTPSLVEWMTERAAQRVWRDCANRVIVRIRERLKATWIKTFEGGDLHRHATKEDALRSLLGRPELATRVTDTSALCEPGQVEQMFAEEVALLTGDVWPLQWNTGRWRDLMAAKSLFRDMINQWFHVPDQSTRGKERIVGRDAEREVAIDLLHNHQDGLPADFVELRHAITSRVTSR